MRLVCEIDVKGALAQTLVTLRSLLTILVVSSHIVANPMRREMPVLLITQQCSSASCQVRYRCTAFPPLRSHRPFSTRTATMSPNEDVPQPDKWSTASERYQERIGDCTKHGTARIVKYIDSFHPLTEDSYCLDVGTGAGSLPIKIREYAPAGTRILATDISPGMLEQVVALKLPNVITQLEDAVTLSGLKDNEFSHVFTSFAIQFTPDPPATIRQMHRVLKPGGMAGIVIWADYHGLNDIHDRACRLIKHDFVPENAYTSKAWSGKDDHRRQLEAAGFQNVGVEAMLMPWKCSSGANHAEYWFEHQNPIPTKLINAAVQQGISRELLRSTMEKLVDEEYQGGKAIYCGAVCGWGTK